MTFPDFLVNQPDGEIVLKGHRITIVDVLFFYTRGEPVEMLSARFPTVALPTLHKLVAFYLENQAEVDAYLTRYHADLETARSNAHYAPSAEELRQRLAARKAAEVRPVSA